MPPRAEMRAEAAWRSEQLQGLVDEFLADPDGLDDVAELEHAALVLRALFDFADAPPELAADFALVLDRRGDELAAGLLTALAAFSYQPLADEAANALAHLSGRSTISPIAERIGTSVVIAASRHEVPGIDLVLALLKRPGESRAQVGMVAIDSYPCGTVISQLEVTPPRRLAEARAALRQPVRGSAPCSLEPSELLDRLAAAADHMDAHAVPLDREAAVWLPALTRALTGKGDALPQLLIEPPQAAELDDRPRAGHASLVDLEAARDGPPRKGSARKQAKRRAARAARRRNRR